ncbi:hypothetical protein [Neorhizobium sp. LjRoot104]|uniref:hypothetical protein n=1 Tax=Neorhizobium sp. LjRoot104 TaxID=3342254 RepID=UPI003ECC3B8D
MDTKRKIDTDEQSERFETDGRKRAEDALHTQMDMTSQQAIKEASRLGAGDTYLVETDLEDLDQREDVDQPDGRPSPLANADNPER